MTETGIPPRSELAEGLLDVLPRLLRRLRADLPIASVEQSETQEWRDIAELRSANGQVALLRILLTQEHCAMQELAERLAVTPPTVTMMVKRLLAQGYVERLRAEHDSRVVWVRPTERGRRAVSFYDQERQASLARRLAQLSASEQQTLQAALPALRHLIEVEL